MQVVTYHHTLMNNSPVSQMIQLSYHDTAGCCPVTTLIRTFWMTTAVVTVG